jgi:cholesterol 7-dehydrogenase
MRIALTWEPIWELEVSSCVLVSFSSSSLLFCLAIGEVTKDNCIQCPFHGWKFGTDGKCKQIPYSEGSIPPQAQTKAYRIMETHRVILLWYDAEDREPSWTLEDAWPQVPDSYKRAGRVTHHIPCHISEVPENGADVAHLNFLHGDVHPIMRDLKKWLDIKFVWTATWKVSAENSNFTDMTLTERFMHGQKSVDLVGTDATIRQVGPALVILSLKSAFGEFVLLQSIVPIDPYHQRLETVMFISQNPLNLTFINRLMLLGYAENVERDVLIWCKKRYLAKPALVKNDGPIAKFRKWFSQFYSENSPTWESIQEEERRMHEIKNW